MSDALELDPDFDSDERQLCPDGGCTGLIGDDGRCKVCGARGEVPAGVDRAAAGVDQVATGADQVAAGIAQAAAGIGQAVGPSPDWRGTDGDGSSDEFDARQLCPDGNCTGLLGADGRCKVCGKSS